MSIKLETSNVGLAVHALVSIQGAGDLAGIALSTEKSKRNDNGNWVEDPTRLRQILMAVGAEGPIELSGIVPESEAVEIAAAFKVVAKVNLVPEEKGAFVAGRVGRKFTALELVQVVEVWATATKCLYRAKDFANSGKAQPELQPDGSIKRVA